MHEDNFKGMEIGKSVGERSLADIYSLIMMEDIVGAL